jgi:formylglycine-generating enzyme required for sulfatase activity
MAKRMFAGTAVMALVIGLIAVIAGAQSVPQLLNYQGRVFTTAGQPVDSDTVPMRFSLLNGDTPGSTLLWGETHTAVQIKQGLYNVVLGSVKPLPSSVFDGATVFMEVQARGQVFSPRQRMTSVAYALRAGNGGGSGGNADTVDGKHAADFAAAVHYHSGGEISSGSVSETYIDPAITRDAELEAGLTTKAGKSDVAALEARVAALETLLANVIRDGNDLTFSNMNVHIVNGSGYTETTGGTGNLIVGYNESRGGGDNRTGSHNIIVGREQDYTSFGGIVAGAHNTVSGAYASVTGGADNTAAANYSSVSAGISNQASGNYSGVSGGNSNQATDYYASVSGGANNRAMASSASVSGGGNNIASGMYASVAGGGGMTESEGNEAYGYFTSILGGTANLAGDPNHGSHSWGAYSTIAGGANNNSFGGWANVAGGRYNIASGDYSFVAGGGGSTVEDGNIAFANYSSILGGSENLAGDSAQADHQIGLYTTISGGEYNRATASYASVAGGWHNFANLPYELALDRTFLGRFMGDFISNPDWDGDSYKKTGSTPDCNDGNANIHPGATEVCDNNIDDNCDGTYDEHDAGCCNDLDHDGFFAEPGCGATIDCDDDHCSVFPGAPEICDSLDNQCPGYAGYGTADEGCVEAMKSIPPGCLNMGDTFHEGDTDELPVHSVCFSAPFYLDKHEVTNAEYKACVDASACAPPSNTSSATHSSYYGNPVYNNYPVIYVNWSKASTYCAWAGKRLPTEAEWEYAGRAGVQGNRFVWGNDYSNYWKYDNLGATDTSEVCLVNANVNSVHDGLCNQSGNVSEWVNDWYQYTYYAISPTYDPPGPAWALRHVIRGGNWYGGANWKYARLADRSEVDSAYSGSSIGFRCAKD